MATNTDKQVKQQYTYCKVRFSSSRFELSYITEDESIRAGDFVKVPFGKEIVYGSGMFSLLVNVIWIIFFGLEMAVANLIIGCLWCITIIGIPFGKQFFKLAQLSLMPFGAQIVR